jgi:HEPN domain-containing protein
MSIDDPTGVDAWLAYAREDLESAKRSVQEEWVVPRHVCFLSQQAAEKALKAVLRQAEIEFPKTHDLNLLRKLVPEEFDLPTEERALARLSQWAVESRYPGDWQPANLNAAKRAVEDATAVVEFCAYAVRPRG